MSIKNNDNPTKEILINECVFFLDLKLVISKSALFMEKASVIILSAGKGERMGSSFPKTLHPVAGKPMLARILQAVQKADFKDIKVIIAPHAENLTLPLIQSFKAFSLTQTSKPGTAGALMRALNENLHLYCLILNGDHPLISAEDLKIFFKQAIETNADIVIGTCSISDPKNMGRIVREGEQIKKIVESYDFTPEIESINEVNTGLMLIQTHVLEKNLKLITNDNPKQEHPITDLISLCSNQGYSIATVPVDIHVAFGVNTQEELSIANSFAFEQKTQILMNQGVIFPNPHQVHIEDDVLVGKGSIIYPGVYLKGHTQIGSFCAIEQNCFIFDCQIDPSVHVKAHCYLEKSHIQSKSIIGPFAHLRPGSVIGKECKIGNFSEIKNTQLGEKTKASHQCYLGDSTIGNNVNIGSGTVICNYAPNKKKHKTKIEDQSFIGSGSMLISPLTIGKNSIIAAGSVITKDVPSKTLAIERTKQQHKKNKLADK